ncbi:Pesticidal crystal cry1Ha [Gossypium arboreum]|uniref:Pesticidal crystal cry1Ha n=1 Tax=Gossypium arboreum TaxID=29729 RepID=A0A0B0NNQ5_GOSAR|nr:Pesticidal crystal cry1Ha [Gossypium arboreum]
MSGTWHWHRYLIPCKIISRIWHWHRYETSCKTIAGLSSLICDPIIAKLARGSKGRPSSIHTIKLIFWV